MTDLLTWEEMSQKFHGEWLLIINAELDESLGVIRGQVIAHSPSQGELYKSLHLVKGQSASIEHVGEVPADLAFIL
jgi:hypothetical protein